MNDETASSDRDEQTRQQVSVLYDPETGRAVHGHTFVGIDDELSAPGGRAERERMLREEVEPDEARRLRFADASPRLRIEGPSELVVVDESVTARPLTLGRRRRR